MRARWWGWGVDPAAGLHTLRWCFLVPCLGYHSMFCWSLASDRAVACVLGLACGVSCFSCPMLVCVLAWGMGGWCAVTVHRTGQAVLVASSAPLTLVGWRPVLSVLDLWVGVSVLLSLGGAGFSRQTSHFSLTGGGGVIRFSNQGGFFSLIDVGSVSLPTQFFFSTTSIAIKKERLEVQVARYAVKTIFKTTPTPYPRGTRCVLPTTMAP